MTTNVPNQIAFLRSSREFPTEPEDLALEVYRTYSDIAIAVNNRTIGIFPTNRATVTGEAWFVNANRRQQTFRQLYTFTAAGSIPHGIKLSNISGFTRIYGTFVDNSGVWYPLPYVDVTAATNQINVIANSTNIVITAGAGSPPAISSGFVVLEWLTLP